MCTLKLFLNINGRIRIEIDVVHVHDELTLCHAPDGSLLVRRMGACMR
jgi:hypothetical protein